jgi:diacylglycerol kinase
MNVNNKGWRRKLVQNLSNAFEIIYPVGDKCIRARHLMKLHFILCYLVIFLFFIIHNKYFRLFIIFGALFVIFTNILFNGCLITKIEQNLCPGMETIMDWPLQLFGFSIHNTNRKIINILFFTLLIFILFSYYKIYYH